MFPSHTHIQIMHTVIKWVDEEMNSEETLYMHTALPVNYRNFEVINLDLKEFLWIASAAEHNQFKVKANFLCVTVFFTQFQKQNQSAEPTQKSQQM